MNQTEAEKTAKMSDYEENDDFMCDDEEDYGLVSVIDIERNINCLGSSIQLIDLSILLFN